jgi:hypothetical protein
MTPLTTAAVFALAVQCVGPKLAPIMTGIVQHENPKLDPVLVSHNTNGTDDVGLAQINTSNFGWLKLDMGKARDPCRSIIAGAEVLLARYNGSPPGDVRAAYSSDVMKKIEALTVPSAAPTPPTTADPFTRPARTGGGTAFATTRSPTQ